MFRTLALLHAVLLLSSCQSQTTPQMGTPDDDDASMHSTGGGLPAVAGEGSCAPPTPLPLCDWVQAHDTVVYGTIASMRFVASPACATRIPLTITADCPETQVHPILEITLDVERSTGAVAGQTIAFTLPNDQTADFDPSPVPDSTSGVAWFPVDEALWSGDALRVGQPLGAALNRVGSAQIAELDCGVERCFPDGLDLPPDFEVWSTQNEQLFTLAIGADGEELIVFPMQLGDCTFRRPPAVEPTPLANFFAEVDACAAAAPSAAAVERRTVLMRSDPSIYFARCSVPDPELVPCISDASCPLGSVCGSDALCTPAPCGVASDCPDGTTCDFTLLRCVVP